jgi:hypothetical protein
MQALWEHKTLYQRKDDFTAEEFYDRAGIWAEFGCVYFGRLFYHQRGHS